MIYTANYGLGVTHKFTNNLANHYCPGHWGQ